MCVALFLIHPLYNNIYWAILEGTRSNLSGEWGIERSQTFTIPEGTVANSDDLWHLDIG